MLEKKYLQEYIYVKIYFSLLSFKFLFVLGMDKQGQHSKL